MTAQCSTRVMNHSAVHNETSRQPQTAPAQTDPHESETDAALQQKIQNMRSKLSMAKEMLEELLAEREELDAAHTEELERLEDTLAEGRRERDQLKLQVAEIKKELDDVDAANATAALEFGEELAKVQTEEAELREQIAAEKASRQGVQEQVRKVSAAATAAAAVAAAVDDLAVSEPTCEEQSSKPFAHVCDQAAHNLAAIFEASPVPPTPPASRNNGSTTEPGFNTPLSAMRNAGRSKRRNRVSFGVVAVRDYEVEIGGGGGLPLEGSPLGLGWSFQPQEPVALEDWEQEREPRRIHKEVFMRQGYIPPDKRREKLLAMGFNDEDLDRAADDTQEIQARRKESNAELTDGQELPALANAFMWWWMVTQGLDSYLD
eukprot:TRINITY_DN33716_c0_g1_i1.p1 TRINITY_DN33716_c0_g1~~TRINITY_DN33716_c0_g1_i1.p1  ORF type:complete len:376 (+),score=90.16 TRINITY_DN33716_c0_g1_i1:88-1215(+)